MEVDGWISQVDTGQLVTLLASSVAALAAVVGAVLSAVNASSARRREWARSALAPTYSKVIRASHVAEEAVSHLHGLELEADEEDPENAPHYVSDPEEQKRRYRGFAGGFDGSGGGRGRSGWLGGVDANNERSPVRKNVLASPATTKFTARPSMRHTPKVREMPAPL